MKTVEHFVDGIRYSGNSKRLSPIYNPATGEEISKVKLGSLEDLNKAVKYAQEAFPSWSNTPPLQRARVLFRFKELIEKNKDELRDAVRDINSLKSEMHEIKSLLMQMMDKK